MLKEDHEVVSEYFEKVKANEDRDNRPTFEKIKYELDAHTHVEEVIFYPHLLKVGDKELTRIVREGIEEHRQAKLFLSELAGLSGDTEKFRAKLKVLIEDVEHHVEEEEGEMFPMVEDQVDREVLVSMREEMEKEKQAFRGLGKKKASASRASK